MPRIRFTLPQVKTHPEGRPDHCSYCQGSILQRHGLLQKPIKDLYLDQVAWFATTVTAVVAPSVTTRRG
jgi:hypothetical protein